MADQTERKRVFILGGGTSVSEVKDDKTLKEKIETKEKSIGCNRAFEFFDVDFLAYHDARFGKHWAAQIDTFIDNGGIVYAPTCCKTTGYNKRVNYFRKSNEFKLDLPSGLYAYNNTGTMSVSLAVALGFEDIYLLGMDLRFDLSNTQSHYHNGYRDSFNVRAKPEQFKCMLWGFRQLGKYIAKHRPDIRLFNCSPISIIDPDENYYKYVDVRKVLNER
jgi:hypothetical protein